MQYEGKLQRGSERKKNAALVSFGYHTGGIRNENENASFKPQKTSTNFIYQTVIPYYNLH
jgi:hypothetical protein